jgi:hypothetical protein
MQEILDALLRPREKPKIYQLIISQTYPMKRGGSKEEADSSKKVE